MSLPSRAELARRVRRFRIEGYELEDLIQECYVCLLDPESDHDIERHLKRLQRRVSRRKPKITLRHVAYSVYDLQGNDARATFREDVDAACLMIAARSECRNDQERGLLKLMAAGKEYGDVCREMRWNYGRARTSVHRLRNSLQAKLYPEKGDH